MKYYLVKTMGRVLIVIIITGNVGAWRNGMVIIATLVIHELSRPTLEKKKGMERRRNKEGIRRKTKTKYTVCKVCKIIHSLFGL